MSDFRIEFVPALKKALVAHPEASFDELDVKRVHELFPGEIDVLYHLDGEIYGYYPSSILTTLNDILLETNLTSERKSHDMTLCGYTVLQIVFSSDTAFFYEPRVNILESISPTPVGQCSASVVLKAFQDALDSVWETIQDRLCS